MITFNSKSSNVEIVDKLLGELKYLIFNLKTQNWNHNSKAMKNYMAPEMTKKICSVFDKSLNS